MDASFDFVRRIVPETSTSFMVPAATGFSPTSLFVGNTGGWWSAASSNLWQDSARTTPATANDDPVGAIDDQSGNGNHLLQATSGDRPLLKISGAIKWLEFDGTSDRIIKAFTCNQPFNDVMTVRLISGSGGDFTLWDGATGNTGRVWESVPPTYRCYCGGNQNIFTAVSNGTDWTATVKWNGASSAVAVDNGSYDPDDTGSVPAAGLCVGSYGGSNIVNANMRWYGGIRIGRSLTDPEIANCRTYFGALAGQSL